MVWKLLMFKGSEICLEVVKFDASTTYTSDLYMHSMLEDVENVGQNWYNSSLTSSVTQNGNEWNESQYHLSNQSKLTLSYALSCNCVILSTNKESQITCVIIWL